MSDNVVPFTQHRVAAADADPREQRLNDAFYRAVGDVMNEGASPAQILGTLQFLMRDYCRHTDDL